MSDNTAVLAGVRRKPGTRYPVLVPNLKGFEAAVAAGATEVAIFAAASEGFSQRNINCWVRESIERFVPVVEAAQHLSISIRGYVSCVIACPYDGATAPADVAAVANELLDLGCYEVSLGDTIGVGTPASVKQMLEGVTRKVPVARLAGHYHDTYGMAIANIYASLEMGMAVFDSSVAGLGGCPYAKGASGNVATEDLVYLLNGLDVYTGVDLDRLIDCSTWISTFLTRNPRSRVARALSTGQAALPLQASKQS